MIVHEYIICVCPAPSRYITILLFGVFQKTFLQKRILHGDGIAALRGDIRVADQPVEVAQKEKEDKTHHHIHEGAPVGRRQGNITGT